MLNKAMTVKDVVTIIKTKKIGAIPVMFHEMKTMAIVEIKNSADESTDLEPLALVITDEIFASIKPVLDEKVKVTIEGYEKQ